MEPAFECDHCPKSFRVRFYANEDVARLARDQHIKVSCALTPRCVFVGKFVLCFFWFWFERVKGFGRCWSVRRRAVS